MSTHIDNLLLWNNRNLNIIAIGATMAAFRAIGIFPTDVSKTVMYVVGFALIYIYSVHLHDIYRWTVKLWNNIFHFESENHWETVCAKMLSLYVPNMIAALICFENVRNEPWQATAVQLPILLIVSIFWMRNNVKIHSMNSHTKSARYIKFEDAIKESS